MPKPVVVEGYEDECIIELENGNSIRCPSFPDPCSYIRVCNSRGAELAYWNSDEIKENPEEVIGAFMGCANGRIHGR